MIETIKQQPKALIYSVVLHLVVIGFTLFEFSGTPVKPVVSKKGLVDETIQAEVIDKKQLDKREQVKKKQQEAEKKKQEQARLKEAAQKRAAEIKKKKEAEQRRKQQEAKKKAEQEKKRKLAAEKKKKQEAEAKRKKAEAERKKKEEAKRKAEAEKKRKAEEARLKAEAEKKRQEEARKKAERDARLKAEAEQRRKEAELKAQIAAEERQRDLDNKRNKYYSLIREKISRNWRQPANAGNKPLCEVQVIQGPGGVILDVTFGNCPGTREYRLSVEAAVLKSDPLPQPEDPELFERNIVLKFKPKE
ncbi:MAG: cell envelope integrity protein TolA [Gammaproteobacteria bacterium]|nr:cell envelope integrity protein TolA [Gammaproteobacteria bacterium]